MLKSIAQQLQLERIIEDYRSDNRHSKLKTCLQGGILHAWIAFSCRTYCRTDSIKVSSISTIYSQIRE